MKKIYLSLFTLVLFSCISAHAAGNNPVRNMWAAKAVKFAVPTECSFSASLTFNILGQTASVTCTATQPTCAAAINEVAGCIKLSKNKLVSVFGL